MNSGASLTGELAVRQAVAVARPGRMLLVTVLADVLGMVLAVAIAYGVRWWLGGTFRVEQLLALWPLPFLAVLMAMGHRLYAITPPHPAEELRRLSFSTTLAFIAVVAASFLLRTHELYSRGALVMAWALALLLTPICRAWIRGRYSRRRWWGVPVAVLGDHPLLQGIVDNLRRWPSRGLRPVVLAIDSGAVSTVDLPHIASQDLLDQARTWRIRHVLLVTAGVDAQAAEQRWIRATDTFTTVLVIPGATGASSLWIDAKDLGGILGLETTQSLLRKSRRSLKRALDVVAVVLGGIALGPLLLLLALLVRLTSAGPVFYSQRRLGRGGRSFPAWKFRTMRSDADAVLQQLLASDPAVKAEWERDHKLKNDPRITGIGRLLRKTSLDELPQLWNVLSGHMSLVGPRPVTEAEIEKYGDHWQLYRRVRPGITGLWQVSGRNHTTYDERVAFDAFYVHNWSPWLDAVILVRTIQTVVRGEGAW